MHQPEAKRKIKATFDKRWPAAGLDTKFQLDFKARIAKELLANETNEYRSKLQEEADWEHERNIEVFENIVNGEALTDEIRSDLVFQNL